MRYKVGDKVRIKSLDQYYKNRDKIDQVDCGNACFIRSMTTLCEKIVTISSVLPTLEVYRIKEDDGIFNWTDEMFEGLLEEETYDFLKTGKQNLPSLNDFMDMLNNEIKLPEGYIFKDENGNIINATKIVLEKKKKEYPKTYEECCKVLGFLNIDLCFNADYRRFDASKEQWKRLGLMNQFYKLLICRDAYLKIAGEEMGLKEPWKPDYDSGVNKYGIICMNGIVQKTYPSTNWERHLNKILDFPTEEMRDVFYENFKSEIESCNELL